MDSHMEEASSPDPLSSPTAWSLLWPPYQSKSDSNSSSNVVLLGRLQSPPLLISVQLTTTFPLPVSSFKSAYCSKTTTKFPRKQQQSPGLFCFARMHGCTTSIMTCMMDHNAGHGAYAEDGQDTCKMVV
uniref:Uncharacterized protein n=1 Tax=Oryza sativa subsp. japonica TaxID=39947 RepID=Q7XHV4_ORYSJ|nr:hypothetical protein [Oryza sativa Japonica Group]BAD30982.1 hypothetical protein [Oryza sativa Japonica Group]